MYITCKQLLTILQINKPKYVHRVEQSKLLQTAVHWYVLRYVYTFAAIHVPIYTDTSTTTTSFFRRGERSTAILLLFIIKRLLAQPHRGRCGTGVRTPAGPQLSCVSVATGLKGPSAKALLYYLARSIQTGHVIVLPPAPVLQCTAVGVCRRSTERTICIAGTLWRRRHLLPRAQVNAVSRPASHRPNGLEQHLPRDVLERDVVGAAAQRRQARHRRHGHGRRGGGGRGFRLAAAPTLAAAADGHVA
jgi:hypothetical protein